MNVFPYFAITTILILLFSEPCPASERPNIVFILADDLGWTDLSCRGSRFYETPHIDRLATSGVSLTHFYMCQNCAPSRAALMSGQYAPRTGIYTVNTFRRGKDKNRKMIPPPNATKLPLSLQTLANCLQESGYTTAMFGKWHLGQNGDYHPKNRGFDTAIVTNNRYFNFKTNPPSSIDRNAYLTDYLTDRAVEFLDAQESSSKPFFLYLPHFAVHLPLQAKPEIIAKYQRKKASGGHDKPAYAAMIESLDESVGRIVAKLQDLNLIENTLVIFTSDNGGNGGYQVPGTKTMKGLTNNAPLRSGKGTLYEGGIRVPFMASWPNGIPKNSTSDAPSVHVDLFPTLAEIAKAKMPTDQIADGVSIAALLQQPGQPFERGPIFWHFPGYLEAYIKEATWRTTPVSAIRDGITSFLSFSKPIRSNFTICETIHRNRATCPIGNRTWFASCGPI